MKRTLLALALAFLPAVCFSQVPDPNPQQLQQIATDLQNLVNATSADQTAIALVASDSAAVDAANAALANDTSAQAQTAAAVQAAYQTLLTDVQNLSLSNSAVQHFRNIVGGCATCGKEATPNVQKLCTAIEAWDFIAEVINSMNAANPSFHPLPIIPPPSFCTAPVPPTPPPAPSVGSLPHLAPIPVSPVRPQFQHARGLKLPPPQVLAALHALDAKTHAAKHMLLRKQAAAPMPASADFSANCVTIDDAGDNQAQCGTCWDFSGCAMVESANIVAGNLTNSPTSSLSKQSVLDGCWGSNGGCNGDDNTTVLGYAKKGGLPLSSAYGQYVAYNQGCQLSTSAFGYTLSDWGYVDSVSGVGSTDLIKAALLANKSMIGCAVAAGNDWDSYQAGQVMNGRSTNVNHDVGIVGWDDTKGNGGAWKVRNSWGPNWGDGGYCWVQYGADSIGTEPVYGTAGPVTIIPASVQPGPAPAPGPSPSRRASVLAEKATRVFATGNKAKQSKVIKAIEAAEAVLSDEK